MSTLNALFLLSHLSASALKCSVYDSPCLASLAQSYASSIIPGGTGFGFEPLDPMCLPPFELDYDGLRFNLSEIEVVGACNTLIEKVQFNKKENRSLLKIRIPTVTVFGNYSSIGHILKIPFNGKGKMIFNMYELEVAMTIFYENSKGLEGKDYIKCVNYLYWYDVRYIETFYEGMNKDDPVKENLAQHIWSEESGLLWQQFGRDFLNLFTAKIFETVKKFLLLQSVETIIYDY